MTKISIDVDFDKDPEAILKQIQERARTEVEKREKKERASNYLENLHSKVNQFAGTSFKNTNELIRALAPFATPSFRERILGVTTTGRRQTVSMTKELYDEIKKGLATEGVTKASIARTAGVSSTQVTKVQRGGYDRKYSGAQSAVAAVDSTRSTPNPKPSPKPSAPSKASPSSIDSARPASEDSSPKPQTEFSQPDQASVAEPLFSAAPLDPEPSGEKEDSAKTSSTEATPPPAKPAPGKRNIADTLTRPPMRPADKD